MEFKKYMHLERFGTSEVEGIEIGTTYVFPKLDGTNASVWFEDGQIKAGSRNRELSFDNDNAGFYKWTQQSKELIKFFELFPNKRLFGEWLVPHSLKTYREDAWRRFYVFDVCDDLGVMVTYDAYRGALRDLELDYISPIAIFENGNYSKFVEQLDKNVFMVKDGEGVGEGVVIKNYDFVNKYGRTTFAKIVTSEFKELHTKEMGASTTILSMIEESIAKKYVTQALVDKVTAKIELDNNGFSSKNIPQLLNTVYYDIIREDMWSILKDFKKATINFGMLYHFIATETKRKSKLFPNK